ncbi:cancer/testis antigen family 47 member C1 [Ovis aries]|uniref:cancer/testis antigen family 47 member C1 n=1 Tax=Ovis aries TaxID=9940 RepID=UPI001C2EAC19|nr:cancer/testis antigen family 47 member C1 [Ovis aries]
MSTTRGGDQGPDGQQCPAGMAGVQAELSRAHEGVDCNSGPRRGDAVPEAGAGGITEASGGPREAALEGGRAEVGEEEQAGGPDLMADAHHFPMAGFRLTLLDLVRSVLSRIYYNDYILVWPHNGHMSVQHRAQQHSSDQGSAAVAEFSELRVSSDGLGEGPAGKAPAQEVEEAEEAEEASLWETAAEESEESSLWEVAQEPAAPEREPSGGEGVSWGVGDTGICRPGLGTRDPEEGDRPRGGPREGRLGVRASLNRRPEGPSRSPTP